MDRLAAAFSLHPEYLRTLDRVAPVRDYTDYTPQLGRRMRALKLWIQLRWFGLEGMRRRIRHHLELAARLAAEVEADPDWELLAPVPFSTVCLRWRPALRGQGGRRGDRRGAGRGERGDHRWRQPLGVPVAYPPRRPFTIRVAIGNPRTQARHVERVWELLREAAATIEATTALP